MSGSLFGWVAERFGGSRPVPKNLTQPAIPFDYGNAVVAASGLSADDQKRAQAVIAGLPREYPGIGQTTMNLMVERTIEYVRERAIERVQDNQLNLFTDAMLAQARSAGQPIDRAGGLQKLEDLALLLRHAEDRMTDNLLEADDMTPWDRVSDQMEIVYGDIDAMRVAAEWGIQSTDFGPPLLNSHGAALHSSELLDRLAQERGRDRSGDTTGYPLFVAEKTKPTPQRDNGVDR